MFLTLPMWFFYAPFCHHYHSLRPNYIMHNTFDQWSRCELNDVYTLAVILSFGLSAHRNRHCPFVCTQFRCCVYMSQSNTLTFSRWLNFNDTLILVVTKCYHVSFVKNLSSLLCSLLLGCRFFFLLIQPDRMWRLYFFSIHRHVSTNNP